MNQTPVITERLYHLLPSIYRQRDAESGEALRALMSVLEQEMRVVEHDIETLYDNWFVDTCQEWVLPYIGELLGVQDLLDANSIITSQRRRIANTIRYRRRKGIGAILENVVYDVTGWHTRIVEFFKMVSITQSMSNIRFQQGRIANLRDERSIEQLGGPFDALSHLVDVRSIHQDKNKPQRRQGKYNVANVGLFLWRLQSYAATERPVYPVQQTKGGFFFNPHGIDMPLFNKAQKNKDLTSISVEHQLPIRLKRKLFESDLNQYKAEQQTTLARYRPSNSTFYGPNRSLNIMVNGDSISPMRVISADLSEWGKEYFLEGSRGNLPSPDVAIDVELGRFLLSPTFLKQHKIKDEQISVDFHYGFSADIGGGPYDRSEDLAEFSSSMFHLTVGQNTECRTLQAALQQWTAHCLENKDGAALIEGVIQIVDNGVYREDLNLSLPPNTQLTIEAMDGKNPCIHLTAPMQITGSAPEQENACLTLNGLRVNHAILIKGGVTLKVLHSTILSPKTKGLADNHAVTGASHGGIETDPSARNVKIEIYRSLVGPLFLSKETAISIAIKDSIIDENSAGYAIASDETGQSWGPPAVLEHVTVFGKVRVQELIASESILTDEVNVERRQVGYIRFSYITPESEVPIKYRCCPEAAQSFLKPHFTSMRYGDPGYAQLSHICPAEIRKGSKDGSEMGAFKHLRQPQREENLRNVIHQYLRQDLEAGFFYMT